MGSVSFYVDRGEATRDAVAKYLGHGSSRTREVLLSSWQPLRGSSSEWSYALYEAVRAVDTGRVSAWVTLVARYRDGHGSQVCVKALHENMGPAEYVGVPGRLLDLLTPTDSVYANEWRAKARVSNRKFATARKLVGKTVRLDHALNYGRLGRIDTFTLAGGVKALGHIGEDRGGTARCRLPYTWPLMPYTVLGGGA